MVSKTTLEERQGGKTGKRHDVINTDEGNFFIGLH